MLSLFNARAAAVKVTLNGGEFKLEVVAAQTLASIQTSQELAQAKKMIDHLALILPEISADCERKLKDLEPNKPVQAAESRLTV